MNSLLLHPATNQQLKVLTHAPPHALVIVGQAGSGKRTVAEIFICEALGIRSTESYPYFLGISPENTLGINEIRQIRTFLGRKTTGSERLRRAILLSDAHRMTEEAQNALLKTLEEPPADTIVVLTADDMSGLKSTIRSRTQRLTVLPTDKKSALSYFLEKGYTGNAIESAYHMSDGRAGLLQALLEERTDHELVSAISQAKHIITLAPYERMLMVESIIKQKDQAELLLMGLERVSISGMRQAANRKNETLVKKFYHISKLAMDAKTLLRKNVNTKVTITDLFIKL